MKWTAHRAEVYLSDFRRLWLEVRGAGTTSISGRMAYAKIPNTFNRRPQLAIEPITFFVIKKGVVIPTVNRIIGDGDGCVRLCLCHVL